jgi:tetratricopeptide (TPR) repeat protein
MGEIYRLIESHKDLDKSLEMFSLALEHNTFSNAYFRAETFYKRGEIYGWQGRDPRESIYEYQRAIEFYPDHPWAHLRLGYDLYRAYGDVNSAEVEIFRAIELWQSDSFKTRPYQYLGEIYTDAGLIEKAIVAYEEVLRIDPNDQQAQEMLHSLNANFGE